MDISNLVLSVAAILISVLSAFYSYRQINIAKWQSRMEYINSLRTWVFETLDTLVSISHLLVSANDERYFIKQKYLLLDRLSAQIEKGRFHLPNIDKGDDYGKEKEFAYRGYRALALDFLVLSYRLLLADDCFEKKRQVQQKINNYQREFLSEIHSIIEPRKFIKDFENEFKYVVSSPNTIETLMERKSKLR